MENKKTTLTIREIYDLESEISGFATNDKVIFEGVLNQKITIVTKYHLNKLLTILKEDKKLVDDSRNDLIKKYGTEKDSNIVIEPYKSTFTENEDGESVENRVVNENFILFNDEYTKLLDQVREVEHYPFNIEEFSNIETNDNYRMLFKLID